MSFSIINNGGICLKINDKKIALDPEGKTDADFIFISHAHLDHVPATETVTPKICSLATKELVQYRKNSQMINTITFDIFDINDIHVRQFNSGHIIGSTSILFETKKRRLFYTGDICDKHRFHLKAADIPRSDVMIIESTYGSPYYKLPTVTEIIDNAHRWIKESLENNNSVILMGYPLGKAQILMKIAETHDFPLIVHDTIEQINEICRKHGFRHNNFIPYSLASEIIKNEQFIAVFPSSSKYIRPINKIKTKFPIKTAGFSGWGLDEKYKNQLGVDIVFPLSDHSDFDGLMKIVKLSSPEKVYTTHGFEDELANEIKTQLGIDAYPLSKTQSTLKNFF